MKKLFFLLIITNIISFDIFAGYKSIPPIREPQTYVLLKHNVDSKLAKETYPDLTVMYAWAKKKKKDDWKAFTALVYDPEVKDWVVANEYRSNKDRDTSFDQHMQDAVYLMWRSGWQHDDKPNQEVVVKVYKPRWNNPNLVDYFLEQCEKEPGKDFKQCKFYTKDTDYGSFH